MSKIRNTPHVYARSVKHLGIQWYPGNVEGFRSPVMTQVEKDRVRVAIARGTMSPVMWRGSVLPPSA